MAARGLLVFALALGLVEVASGASLAQRLRWAAVYNNEVAQGNGTNGSACGGNGTNGTNGSNGTGCGASTTTTTTTAYWTRPWDGNTMCIPQTGRRCFGGPSDCAPWVACSEDFHCVCHHWGCADSAGQCRPVHNQWVDTEVTIAPMPRHANGHYYLSMPATGNLTRPKVIPGYSNNDEPEAKWNFLVQPDGRSVMITTKLNKAQTNERHTAYGFFLDLPPAPWVEGHLLSPMQARPKDALEAAWRLVSRPQGRVGFQHISSGRFLCFDEPEEKISSCSETYCEKDGKTIDFDIWPKPRQLGQLLGEAQPPTPAPIIDVQPFKQRDANTSAATDRGFLSRNVSAGAAANASIVVAKADASIVADHGQKVSHRVFAQKHVATHKQ